MVVQIKDLVKRYKGLTAVDHFDLDVKEGEILGLLGPNGSGKTTIIHCILSLLKYDKGSIHVFEKPISPSAYDIKKNIGVVMQNIAVFNELTVYENIDYFCGLYIQNRQERACLVNEAIEFVGLNDFRKFYPKKLSGGLLRRLNIACGIAHKPKLILLDEPTVAVDPQSRNNILEGIQKLNREGATIIYTSHYMEEVEQICSRIVIMDKGKSVVSGTSTELKSMIHLVEKVTLEITDLPAEIMEKMQRLPTITKVTYENNMLCVHFMQNTNNLINLLENLKPYHLNIGKIYSEQPSLNDVFLEITGKELRD